MYKHVVKFARRSIQHSAKVISEMRYKKKWSRKNETCRHSLTALTSHKALQESESNTNRRLVLQSVFMLQKKCSTMNGAISRAVQIRQVMTFRVYELRCWGCCSELESLLRAGYQFVLLFALPGCFYGPSVSRAAGALRRVFLEKVPDLGLD